MDDFISKHWPEVTATLLSIIALLLSIQTWYKSRAIYDIAHYKLPKAVGNSRTPYEKRIVEALRQKLATGKWQILHFYEVSNNTLIAIIGKIRK